METLISVYLEDIKTGGQTGFEWFENEVEAEEHFQKVRKEIRQHGKELEFEVVKRLANYDRQNNRVSFS